MFVLLICLTCCVEAGGGTDEEEEVQALNIKTKTQPDGGWEKYTRKMVVGWLGGCWLAGWLAGWLAAGLLAAWLLAYWLLAGCVCALGLF